MSDNLTRRNSSRKGDRTGSLSVQLREVRRSVNAILQLFGRNNIFSEYTVHDFSHVESMLRDLEWLIEEKTRDIISPADWLMLTLAIYFHDLGLVVTESEYNNRKHSGFDNFCKNVLFKDLDGKDYEAKVRELGDENAERFFYQEFVRYNHAKRIRSWIAGKPSLELGYAEAQINEIRLSNEFRTDLLWSARATT